MEEFPNLINICPTDPIQTLKQILCVSFKWYFWQKQKISMLVLGLHSKDRKSTRDKAIISNPKVNRGCPPLTANRSSADCVQISLGPSIKHITLRVYPTGGGVGFNTMPRGPSYQNDLTLIPAM